MQVAIKLFQIRADWLLLNFTTVQAIMKLRSCKSELNELENLYDKRLMIDGRWWFLFPYNLYLEKKALKKVLHTSQSQTDRPKIERSKNFLLRSEAWLYIVLGSIFYLVSTIIDIATSLIIPPVIVVLILPPVIISTAFFTALRFLNAK